MESCNLPVSVVGLDYPVSSHEDSLFRVGSKKYIYISLSSAIFSAKFPHLDHDCKLYSDVLFQCQPIVIKIEKRLI